ncbi:MAG: hypothetical protein ACXVHQ_32915 [Solirubrobacteraceae bacterium]
MFTRISTFRGSLQDLDQGITLARERIVPTLEEHQGFKGLMLIVDRAAEVASAITFWKSEEDLGRQSGGRPATERDGGASL